jgi:hypothetical protein
MPFFYKMMIIIIEKFELFHIKREFYYNIIININIIYIKFLLKIINT